MDNPVIQESVGFHLIHAWKHHRNLFGSELNEIGLQRGEELVLAQLAVTNGIPQSAIADALSLAPPRVSKFVNALEKQGLVTRQNDPDDGRVLLVFLTEQGEEMIEPIEECWRRGENVMLDGFTDEERLLLRRMLIRIRENIDMPEEESNLVG